MHSQIEVASSSKVEVKVPLGIGDAIRRELAKPAKGYYERVVLALVGLSSTSTKDSVILHSIHPVPDESYIPTEEGTSWDQKFTAEIVSKALKDKLGVLVLHAHGFSDRPNLSPTDRASFGQLLVRLRVLLPQNPHGSAVLGKGNSMGGLVWLPRDGPAGKHVHEIRSVTWLGSPVVAWPVTRPKKIPDRPVYERQITLLGEGGQERISSCKVGIVGLGGGGSHVVQQVAHAGFGSFVLVDPDIAEVTNLHRMIGSVSKDVGRTPKTEIMSRLISSVNKHAKVVELQEEFPTDQTIQALKGCEVVFSCVDTFKARVPLIDFAWRHGIPLIDIGLGTQMEGTGSSRKLAQMTGHVHVYIPGGPCMWCSGFITKAKLDAESGGRGPEYVHGVASPAQIVSANGVVASLAVTEAMQLLTGFMKRPPNEPSFRIYDAVGGKLYVLQVQQDPGCPHCASSLGFGDPTWRGESLG